jgi:hypothetical protein
MLYYLPLLTFTKGCFSRVTPDDYKSYVPGFRHVDPNGEYHPITLGPKIAFAVVGTSQNVATVLVMQDLIEMFGFSFVIADSSHCKDSLSSGFEDGTFFKQEFSRVSSKVEQILYGIKESTGRDVRKYCISDFLALSIQLEKAGYSWHSLTKKKGDIWIYLMPTAIHLDFRKGNENPVAMATEYGLDSRWMGVSSGGFIIPVCYDSDGKC